MHAMVEQECITHISIVVSLPHTTVALECTTPRTALTKMLVGSLIPRSPQLAVSSLQVRKGLVGTWE